MGHVGPATPQHNPHAHCQHTPEGGAPSVTLDTDSDDDSGADIDIVSNVCQKGDCLRADHTHQRPLTDFDHAGRDHAWSHPAGNGCASGFEFVERIELRELAGGDGERVRGHRLTSTQLKAPTWCDQCGDFIWGIYKQCYTCDSEYMSYYTSW